MYRPFTAVRVLIRHELILPSLPIRVKTERRVATLSWLLQLSLCRYYTNMRMYHIGLFDCFIIVGLLYCSKTITENSGAVLLVFKTAVF